MVPERFHEEQLGVAGRPEAERRPPCDVPVPCVSPHHGQVRQMACFPPLPGSSWPSPRGSPRPSLAPQIRGTAGAKECLSTRPGEDTVAPRFAGGVWEQLKLRAYREVEEADGGTPAATTASGSRTSRRRRRHRRERGQYAGARDVARPKSCLRHVTPVGFRCRVEDRTTRRLTGGRTFSGFRRRPSDWTLRCRRTII
jgi:hypothetical protein